MTQIFRAPKLDLASILTSQVPHIDLRTDAYEVSTRNFLTAVSAYTQRALTEIGNRKNAYVQEKKKIADKIQQIESETNNCKVREIELIAGMTVAQRYPRCWKSIVGIALDKEQDEKKEAEHSVAALRRQLSMIRERCTSVNAEVEQYRAILTDLRKGQL